MKIDIVFYKKCQLRRKNLFDENNNNEIELEQSPEESFRNNYFIYIVDQFLSSLKNRLNNFKYMRIFLGFYLI
jgi:hypothetical protein